MSVEDEAAADIDMVDIDPVISIDVEDAARARRLRARRRKAKSFIAGEESMTGGEIQVQSELEVIGIDPVFLSFSFSNRGKVTQLRLKSQQSRKVKKSQSETETEII